MKKIAVAMPLPPPEPHLPVDGAFFAREAESLGFESMWVAEHVIAPAVVTQSQSPHFEGGQVPGFQDPLIALARASAVTSRIRLGTGVLLVAEYQPLRLAKQVATLDRYSGGRLMLGVGAGWLREEAEVMGVDFDHRWAHVREAVLAMKAVWTGQRAEYHGKYYDFPSLRSTPTPVQQPHPPILLGGVASNVLKRVVAYGDGWTPQRVTPEDFRARRLELLELARQAGRDPKKLDVTVFGKPPEPDLLSAYLEAGADRVVIQTPIVTSEAECAAALRDIAKVALPLAERF